MSFMDVDQLSSLDLVTQYIMEVRGRGHFVTREETSVIQSWLDLAENKAEVVILVLEEIFPDRLAKALATNRKNVTMSGINRSVRKKLEDRKALVL